MDYDGFSFQNNRLQWTILAKIDCSDKKMDYNRL